MKILFNIKYINRINLLLLSIYIFPVFFTVLNTNKIKKEFTEQVVDIQIFHKRNIFTTIELSNRKKIEYHFYDDFFNQNSYLDIQKGNFIKYGLKNNSVIGIENLKNNHELSSIYFVRYDFLGLSYLVMFIMLFYNVLCFIDMKLNLKQYDRDKKMLKLNLIIDKINYLSKKNKLITLIIISIFVYFVYVFFQLIKKNQDLFSCFFAYKYFFVISALIIPIPYSLLNFIMIKKLKKHNFFGE